MAKIYENFKITINDVNSKFVCTNKAILRILETIACTHSDQAGYGANNIEKTRLTWVLIGWKVKIINRPRYGDTVNVETWARDTGKITTHRDFKIFSANKELLVIASTKWALIDIDKGLTRINDIIKEHYTPEDERVFEEVELKKLTEPKVFDKSFIYTVQRKDLDINQHVHNLNYLDYAYELLPNDDYYSELPQVEIYYKTEAKLKDKLNILLTKETSGYVITIKNQLTDNLLAIVKLSR